MTRLLVAIVGLTSACLTREPLIGPEAAGAVQMATSVAPTVLYVGDSATVQVTAYNPTARSLVFTFGSGCQLVFQVLDSNDREAGSIICLTVPTRLTLAPGETRTQPHVWRVREPSTLAPGISPGTYRIVGVLGQELHARSTPVDVEVRVREQRPPQAP